MANRHAHKKLRAEIRARMDSTGESYQKSRARILSAQGAGDTPQTDLVPLSYFGVALTLATIEMHGVAVAVLVPSSSSWSRGSPSHPYPLSMLRAWMRPRGGMQ